MKKISFFLLFFIFLASGSPCREAGWVPIPKSPESGPGKNYKTDKTKKAPAKARAARKNENSASNPGKTVYDNQTPVTSEELLVFVELLPQFRAWAKQRGEKAYPIVSESGKPDFVYSANASRWVAEHKFDDRRFFCIMGKLAAGMVIVEEGNDLKGTRPPDMPDVSAAELELVRRHMGELLNAGRNVPLAE